MESENNRIMISVNIVNATESSHRFNWSQVTSRDAVIRVIIRNQFSKQNSRIRTFLANCGDHWCCSSLGHLAGVNCSDLGQKEIDNEAENIKSKQAMIVSSMLKLEDNLFQIMKCEKYYKGSGSSSHY